MKRQLFPAVIMVATLFSGLFVHAQELAPTETIQEKIEAPKPSSSMRSYSQALYFPSQKQSRLTLAPRYYNSTTESKGKRSGAKYSSEFSLQAVDLDYNTTLGSPDLGLKLGSFLGTATNKTKDVYSDGTETGSYDYGGLGDLHATVTKAQTLKNSQVYFGADLGVSPGAGIIATRSKSGNFYSGGLSLSPFISIEKETGFGSIGGRMIYSIFGARAKEVPGDNYQKTTTGGNSTAIAAFTEYKTDLAMYGAGLELRNFESRNVEIKSDFDDKYDLEAYSDYTMKLYGAFALTEETQFIPALSYNSLFSKEQNDVEITKADDVTLTLNFAIGIE